MKVFIVSTFIGSLLVLNLEAQLWYPDKGDGRYKNPVIYADYSDPDVIRAGKDFYLVASSFNCMPGIPVLHSTDLVNWEIINHVYQRLPLKMYDKPQHGSGAWAPSIRFHNGKFYVYFCTPYNGLFVATTNDPAKEWELRHILDVEYWEDPCPFWDEDGSAWLVRSKLCGNELFLHKMSPDGLQVLDNGISIYRDPAQPTIEGPKLFKKDGFYYILAPAGGVSKGWQTALRSEKITGPYEAKIVMHQGNTDINGPHQGGMVELESGETWFMHFQDKGPYGRIVHLQPAQWVDGWPLIGVDQNDDGIGEPVMEYAKPDVGDLFPARIPQTTDDFEEGLGLQWQWHANPEESWFGLQGGKLRLNAVQNFSQSGDLWFVPNLLLQKFPSPEFTVTAKIEFHPDLNGDRAGLVVMGEKWAFLVFEKSEGAIRIASYEGEHVRCDPGTGLTEAVTAQPDSCFFRLVVTQPGVCRFSYSYDNINYTLIGREFQAQPGKWIGAKAGIFCLNPNIQPGEGFAEFDWFRVE